MINQTDQANQDDKNGSCDFLKTMAKTLSQSYDYRVLKRFDPVKEYNIIDIGEEEKLIGIYLDTETTGLDYKKDKIIELALVPFEYSLDGRVFKILESFLASKILARPLMNKLLC